MVKKKRKRVQTISSSVVCVASSNRATNMLAQELRHNINNSQKVMTPEDLVGKEVAYGGKPMLISTLSDAIMFLKAYPNPIMYKKTWKN